MALRRRHYGQRVWDSSQLEAWERVGLVGHWVGDGVGLTLRDRSGDGLSGAISGAITWGLGQDGTRAVPVSAGAVAPDPSITVTDGYTKTLKGKATYTVAFWTKLATFVNSPLWVDAPGTTGFGFFLESDASGGIYLV